METTVTAIAAALGLRHAPRRRGRVRQVLPACGLLQRLRGSALRIVDEI